VTSRPLWTCPSCGRTFANPNQTHTCALLCSLDSHFTGKDKVVRDLFDLVLAVISARGPVTVLPEKTRIALHVRMSFAALMPRRHWLDGHLVLARRVDHSRFRKIEVYSPRNILHTFRLHAPADVDQLSPLLTEAYDVGAQYHLRAQ